MNFHNHMKKPPSLYPSDLVIAHEKAHASPGKWIVIGVYPTERQANSMANRGRSLEPKYLIFLGFNPRIAKAIDCGMRFTYRKTLKLEGWEIKVKMKEGPLMATGKIIFKSS